MGRRWTLEHPRPVMDLLEHTHATPVYAPVWVGTEHPAADQLYLQAPV